MTIKHAMNQYQFNEEQRNQMRCDSFKTADQRVYLFEGATVLVDTKTNTIISIGRVPGKAFEPIIAVRRIAYYLGYVIYEGERHETEILRGENSPFAWLYGKLINSYPNLFF